ncbi:MAG: FAD binding domain-containing protein [Acidobacteria bacterium]|nr:FAD binding domain-containing protein [Acidobacteriota bacterium]
MIRPFEYHAPRTPREVTELLLAHPGAALLAGGTDLLVDMRAGVVRPAVVLDLKRVEGLDECRFDGGGGPSFVGASVTLNRVAGEAGAPDFLREAAVSVGTHQVRNRATLAGNLCHASPAADTAPPLLALGASVRVRRTDGGEATVPLDGFFAGVKRTALGPGEWVLGVEIPPRAAVSRGRFRKRQRVRGHDLAVVNAAACACPDAGTLRLAVGACAPVPLVFALDDLLPSRGAAGAPWIEAAWARVAAALRPISDNRGSAEYRTDMAKRFVTGMLAELAAGAG